MTDNKTEWKTDEKQWRTREQLAQRMLVLTNQLGDIAHDIQVATTQRGVPAEDMSIFRRDMEDDYADVLAQVYMLGEELGLVHGNVDLNAVLRDGLERMERRKQEYIARGWEFI